MKTKYCRKSCLPPIKIWRPHSTAHAERDHPLSAIPTIASPDVELAGHQPALAGADLGQNHLRWQTCGLELNHALFDPAAGANTDRKASKVTAKEIPHLQLLFWV